MENQESTKKIILNYGLLLGLAVTIVEVANYAMGDIYDVPILVSTLTKGLFIGFIVMGIKKFKLLNHNILSMGEAMKIGIGIALIAGVIGFVYQYVLMTYLEPDFMANALEVQERIILEQNPEMSDEQLEMVGKMTSMMSSPLVLSALIIASNLIGGLIVSLIAGAIMKKEQDLY